MKVVGIKDKENGNWFTNCEKCGQYLEKRFVTDDKICSCGWIWKGITLNKREDIKVGLIQMDK